MKPIAVVIVVAGLAGGGGVRTRNGIFSLRHTSDRVLLA